MQGPQRTTRPNGFPIDRSASARVVRGPFSLGGLLADAVWSVMHTLGAHRWRDGYETNLERGWSRYRGSRCTVCDEPWEGW
jgi:hypothetical protein